jgi:hypothetical protein
MELLGIYNSNNAAPKSALSLNEGLHALNGKTTSAAVWFRRPIKCQILARIKEFYVSNMGEAALKIHKNLKLKKSTEHSGFSNKINHHPILK